MSADDIIDLHRQTVFGSLTRTLELVFPTIHRLVGNEFFTQVAHHYIAARPPRSPVLSLFGASFPEFIGTEEHCAHLAYLKDVASFDLVIDRVAHHAPGEFDTPLRLSPNADLLLDRSLRCLAVQYPVDAIRDAIEDGREDLLSQLDMEPVPRYFAAWMGATGVRVRPIGQTAYTFMVTLGDAGNDSPVTTAAPAVDTRDAVDAIQQEVLCAPYARISMRAPE